MVLPVDRDEDEVMLRRGGVQLTGERRRAREALGQKILAHLEVGTLDDSLIDRNIRRPVQWMRSATLVGSRTLLWSST
jgi:hypothetical protein